MALKDVLLGVLKSLPDVFAEIPDTGEPGFLPGLASGLGAAGRARQRRELLEERREFREQRKELNKLQSILFAPITKESALGMKYPHLVGVPLKLGGMFIERPDFLTEFMNRDRELEKVKKEPAKASGVAPKLQEKGKGLLKKTKGFLESLFE